LTTKKYGHTGDKSAHAKCPPLKGTGTEKRKSTTNLARVSYHINKVSTGEMKANRIDMVSGGRFFSHHDDTIVYFDSRHRVTKTKLEGGLMGELVEQLQPEDIVTSTDWPKRSYRHQLETVNGGDGISVIEL
jgi:hypothetical protein